MSSKRLGKGINAIINTNSKKGEKTISAPGVSKIQLKDIKPNPDQPRRDFNERSLDELHQNSLGKFSKPFPMQLRKVLRLTLRIVISHWGKEQVTVILPSRLSQGSCLKVG